MAQIRYLAPKTNYKRILRAEDLAGLGIDHPETIIFEQSTEWTVEMSDGACETLARLLPEEFVLLESPTAEHLVMPEEAGTFTDDEQADELSEDASPESPDDSVIEADVTINESPRPKVRKR